MPGQSHLRLRDATRAPHLRLEERTDILARVADRASRAAVVQAFSRFHAELEAVAAPWLSGLPGLDFHARRRTPVLERDLAALGVAGAPPVASDLAAGSVGEALGLMYVAEGSTLGGRVIRREVGRRGLDFVGLGFLDPYGERSGERWRAFLAVLEHHTAAAGVASAAIDGALAGFRHAELRLCEETPA